MGILDVVSSEPWPALVLPAFKHASSSKAQIIIQQVHFFVENSQTGELTEVKTHKLFPNIPRSQLSGVMKLQFSDSVHTASFSIAAKDWLKARLKQLQLAGAPHKLIVRWLKQSYRLGSEQHHVEIQNQFTINLNRE